MTVELIITDIGDTWVNVNRPGTDYSRASGVRLKSGERYVYLLPELPVLAGATILDAYLVGRGAEALVAQTITVRPPTERWAPGRIGYDDQPALGTSVATAISATAAADEPFELTGLASILQAVADGSDWYGLRLGTSTTTDQRLRSTDSGFPAWELHILVADEPDAPDNLRPTGGGAVSTATPILAWETFDFGTEDDAGQAEFQVQVDTPASGVEPDDVAPDFDTGWILGVDPQYDLASSAHVPAGAGPHYWRVRVKDADGNESEWSDWGDYTVAALPSLVMDSPTGPFGDPSPTILAHLDSGTLSHWKARITGPDRSDVRLRSNLRTGSITWDVPFRNPDGRRVLLDDETSWLHLQVWPEGDRAVAVGEPGYVEEWIPLTFDDDLGVVAPTNLSVHQYAADDPRNIWSVSRTEAPEALLYQVDGVTVARVELADLTVDAGVYTWTDGGEVTPMRPHTLSVRAVDGAARSTPVSVGERAHIVEGVWLLPDDGDPIVLDGTAVGGFANPDNRARYQPLVGPPVDIIYDPNPGTRGAFAGTVDSRQDVWAALDAIEALKASRTRKARLVYGSRSLYGRVVDPDAQPSEAILPNNEEHDVRFEFTQAD